MLRFDNYANSTLMRKTKKELIDYIRVLESNMHTVDESFERQCAYVQKEYFDRVKRGEIIDVARVHVEKLESPMDGKQWALVKYSFSKIPYITTHTYDEAYNICKKENKGLDALYFVPED